MSQYEKTSNLANRELGNKSKTSPQGIIDTPISSMPSHTSVNLAKNPRVPSHIRHRNALNIQRQRGNRYLTNKIQREWNAERRVLILGPFELQTYGDLISGARFLITQLQPDLEGIDEYVPTRQRANEWIEGANSWIRVLSSSPSTALDEVSAGQAENWYNDWQQIRRDVQDYKRSQARDALRRAQAAIEARRREIQRLQPQVDEQLRSAYLTNNSDTLGQVVSFAANVSDVGLGLADISRQIASGLSSMNGTTIPPASRYTGMLQSFNQVLAATNFIYNYQNAGASGTEVGAAMSNLNNLTSAFGTGGTLLNLAPHIGLYTNLYLGPAVQVATARAEQIIRNHGRNWAEYSLAMGQSPDMRNQEGGAPMFDFLVEVMHASNSASIPAIPSQVNSYLMDNRGRLETGTGEAVPTVSSYIFWSNLDERRAKRWVYNNRQRLWALFYGGWEVPPAGTRARR